MIIHRNGRMEETALDNKKRKHGDRKDGVWIRDTDSMHTLLPHMLPNRADNEAVLNEVIDLTAVNEYIAKKNAAEPAFKYTFFHVICAALIKTLVLRPKLNRFYAGKRFYQRNDYSISFIVKKEFADSSEEAVAIIKADPESEVSPVEQIHSKVEEICTSVRKEHKTDGTTDIMDTLTKMPTPILSFVMNTLAWLDFHGWYPTSLMLEDPYFSSIFVSNLGSIKMNASYHHLTNWGTNSFFVIVGEKKPTAFFNLDGSYEVREALELGITLDERIADGYYYSRSIKLVHKLLDNPELLDRPTYEPVDF